MQLSLQHLRKMDDISLHASSHFHETPRLTTSSHFLDTGKTTNEPWIVHSTWLTKLLSLIIMLLQLPAEKPETPQPGEALPMEKEDSSSKQDAEGGCSSSQSVVDALADASSTMVTTLQAMAKAVEKNATQAAEETQTIINVIEEESSSSVSETETSGAEEEESLLSTDNTKSDDKNEDMKDETMFSPPSSPRPSSILPDKVIHEDDICMDLLLCLNLCSSNNIGVLLTGANILNSSGTKPVTGEPVSVEDGILQVMTVIFSQLSHKDMLIGTVIRFLSGNKGSQDKPRPVTHVSEPFLWFLLRMLDSNKQVAVFCAQGMVGTCQ